jgi:signal transduction histidine kinase
VIDSGSTPDPRPMLTHSLVIGERLSVHTQVRLFVALLILLGALFARHVLGMTALNVPALAILAAVIAGYDAIAWIVCRRHCTPSPPPESYRKIVHTMYWAIVLDYLALTIAVWLVGGAHSPFLVFYLLHVMLGCLLLSRRGAIWLAILAYALLTALVLGEHADIIPRQHPMGEVVEAVTEEGDVVPINIVYDWRDALTVLLVYGMLFTGMCFLLIGLSESLRRGERQLHDANEELNRLSDMRKDFLHIALHNLQSPIGAATMFLRNIRKGLAGPTTEQQEQWLDRSMDRLGGLSEFMGDLQTLASLESGAIDAQARTIDLAPMLREMVEEHRDEAEAHGHTFTLNVPDALPPVRGIERLLREAIVNYVTNAIKYTPDGGTITVSAKPFGGKVRIEVADNGVGISEENQAKLFSEFSRIKRTGTPVDKVKGTGLGLSIVKRVIEFHGGTTGVRSALDKGSTFHIFLPVAADD